MNTSKKHLVAILGASHKPERFSFKAWKMLEEHGFSTRLVAPGKNEIEGQKVFEKLSDISEPIDTLTVYVNSDLSTKMKDEILSLPLKRVVFNPGTENAELAGELRKKGVEVVEACTLVMLGAGRF